MAAIRKAQVVWEGDLAKGKGLVTAASSGAYKQLAVTWGSRTEAPEGKTSPEELIASAHASCFAMALSAELGRAGSPPQKLEVTAAVTFDKADAGYRITSSALEVRGAVKGLDEARFAEIAGKAKEACPVSQALKGNVQVELRTSLSR